MICHSFFLIAFGLVVVDDKTTDAWSFGVHGDLTGHVTDTYNKMLMALLYNR
jgi:hypothetical protein